MKYGLFVVGVWLSYIHTYTMESSNIRLPNALVLRKVLKKAGYRDFIKETKIESILGDQVWSMLHIKREVTHALINYGYVLHRRILQNQEVIIQPHDVLRYKNDVLQVILQFNHEALKQLD